MSSPTFRIVPLGEEHDKKTRALFNSGSAPLDEYFRKRVTQDVRNRITKCFVALQGNHIVGFYTLASMSVKLQDLPPDRTKRLPRYQEIPAVRIGRLAVDIEFRGKGLGSLMLFDAFNRVRDLTVGAYALIVDAKDDKAKGFYLHHGFMELLGKRDTLFLPVTSK